MQQQDEFTIRSIRISKVLIEKIQKKAKEENRNFNNMVETVLMNFIRSNESAPPSVERDTPIYRL